MEGKVAFPNSQNIIRQEMSNGVVVLLYTNPYAQTAIVEGGLWAGVQHEAEDRSGLASFVAASLMRGTINRSFEQIYDEMEAVGASAGHSSGYQLCDFSAESLPEDLDLILDILADTLRHPTFPDEEIEKVRKEKLTSIMMNQNNTRSMAQRKFRETLYKDHIYARSVGGTLESVPAFSRDDLVSFHEENFDPNGLVVTLVSNLSADVAMAKIERSFGDWQTSGRDGQLPIAEATRPDGTVEIHHEMAEKTQSDVVLGLPGPRRNASDFNDIRMANNILGVFGMMGRLGQTVRVEQGLAYYANSRLSPSLGPSPWFVSTGVSPDKVDQAVGSIRNEIRRMQDEPVSAEELADSQAYLTGSLPMSIETSDGIADTIFTMEYLKLGLDYLEKYNDMINDVTVERVQAAAQKYLSADDVVISVAGPKV